MSKKLTITFDPHPIQDHPPNLSIVIPFTFVCYDLWDELSAAATPVDGPCWLYDEGGRELITTDAYGCPMKWIGTRKLSDLLAGHVPPGLLLDGKWNQAAWNYVMMLPDDTPAYLYFT